MSEINIKVVELSEAIKKLAEIKGILTEKVIEITSKNAHDIFDI